jgi:hypothetical protein
MKSGLLPLNGIELENNLFSEFPALRRLTIVAWSGVFAVISSAIYLFHNIYSIKRRPLAGIARYLSGFISTELNEEN